MKNLKTPLISIFSDNDDSYIPVVELDFFNRKGLHPHPKEDLENWDIKNDYIELYEKYQKDLLKANDEFTRYSVKRKYTSTIPSKNNSKIPLFHDCKIDNALKNFKRFWNKSGQCFT